MVLSSRCVLVGMVIVNVLKFLCGNCVLLFMNWVVLFCCCVWSRFVSLIFWSCCNCVRCLLLKVSCCWCNVCWCWVRCGLFFFILIILVFFCS